MLICFLVNLSPTQSLPIALMNSPNEPDFYFPLDYAIPNKTIPGVYHVRANLKPLECIPSRKFLVSVKLEYAFMHDTPKDKLEFFGHLDVEPFEQYISFGIRTFSKPHRKHYVVENAKQDQWIHIIGDSNSNYLFNQLVSEKLGIQECYRDFGFPANSVCFRDSFGHNLQPWNAFDGLTLPQLLEKEEFKKILPRLEDYQVDGEEWVYQQERSLVWGLTYDHQTPNAMNITMTGILDRIMAQKDRSHYKETAIFVTETPVLTSEFPPQYGTLLHQNNARIMERNRMIIHNCRKRGFKCLDIYGFAKAQNEWMEPGDGLHFKSGQEGHVYNRVSDTLFMEMGYLKATMVRQIEQLERERNEAKQALETAMKEKAPADTRADLNGLLQSVTFELKGLRDEKAALIHKEAAVIMTEGAIEAAKVAASSAEKDWSHVTFYSKYLADSVGLSTPWEQWAASAGVLVGIGYSTHSFYRAHHLLELTRYEKNSEKWMYHWARARVTPDQIALARYWIGRFKLGGFAGVVHGVFQGIPPAGYTALPLTRVNSAQSIRNLAGSLSLLLILVASTSNLHPFQPVSQFVILPLLLTWTRYLHSITQGRIQTGLIASQVTGLSLAIATSFNTNSNGIGSSFFVRILIGCFISFATLIPMHASEYVKEAWFPVGFVIMWQVVYRISPFGTWGSWSYLTEEGTMQLMSLGGMAGLDTWLSLWADSVVKVVLNWLDGDTATNHVRETTPNDAEIDEDSPFLDTTITPALQVVKRGKLNVSLRNAFITLPALLLGSLWGNYRVASSPLPVTDATFLKIGCVVDHSNLTLLSPQKGSTIADYYFQESVHLASQGAKIILWPESTLQTTNPSEIIQTAQTIAIQYKTYIGLTYTSPADPNNAVRGLFENKLTLVGPDGIVFDYAKQHPVPFIESGRIKSGSKRVPVVSLPVLNAKHSVFRDVVVSAGICLDLDHPDLFARIHERGGKRVDLVLSPAGTWDVDVGSLHMRMASGRAIENGFGILRCDAKNGVSGYIDSKGRTQRWPRALRSRLDFLETKQDAFSRYTGVTGS
ncbi:hypothetical protein BDR26DRAFT_924258 [Obelidium mucronatum]|nr:hypothetical protein BDR26DRAFT_924258 [Obelidium mucronatum]